MRIFLAVPVAIGLLLTPVHAKRHHYHHHHRHRHHFYHHSRIHRTAAHRARPQWALNGLIKATGELYEAGARALTRLLPHPSGCPAVAFCGCGAEHDLGMHDRSLWLAANWYRFPRSAPGHDKVAVQPHHVFVLKYQIRGTIWEVADYNSGGHLSRLHPRDIRGYTIVSP